MRKHLSVLGLWGRMYGGKAAAVLAVAAALEAALFGWRLLHPASAPPTLESCMGGLPYIAGVAAVTVAELLIYGGDSGAGAGYTLRRLSVREETAALWKALFNLICLVGLWAVQAATALALCIWYAASLPAEYRTGQTVFLAFHRVTFLHNLLPLDDWTRALRNIVLLSALALTAAVRGYKLRRGSRFGWAFALFVGGLLWFSFTVEGSSPGTNVLVSLVALCAMAVDLGYLIEGLRGTEDED